MSGSEPQPGQPYAGMPPIVINNVATSAASASASAGYGRRRRQSFAVHCWLFLFTAGIGNVIYAAHVSRWNRERGL